jgi:hypothetical protein
MHPVIGTHPLRFCDILQGMGTIFKNFLYICSRYNTLMRIIMATMTFPRQLLVTVDDNTNIANLTRAIRMLRGVTAIKPAKSAAQKPRLYDPETGEYLNDKTMKAIEDVRSGKDKGTTYESFEEFKKAMLAL